MKRILCSLLALVMCISMAATVFAAEMKFTDVKKSDWFYDDVKTAVESGLVNGKSATTYAPNDNLTYAEAIKLAACMNQLYNNGAVTLKGGEPWYQPYVEYCLDKKIIDTEYNYDSYATRAGYMGIFAKALPDSGLKEINDVPDNSIPDVASSAGYATGIYKLYRAGILRGVDEEHNCNPLANITRAEVAAILTRMMNEDKRVEFKISESEESITNTGTINDEDDDVKTPTQVVKTEPDDDPVISEVTVNTQRESIVVMPENTYKPEIEDDGSLTLSILTIAKQPQGKISDSYGEKAELEVQVYGGKAPYKYEWQYNGYRNQKTKIENNDYIKNADSAVLVICVEKENTVLGKLISCKITDSEGTVVTTDTVKVYGPFSMPVEDYIINTSNQEYELVGQIADGVVKKGDKVSVERNEKIIAIGVAADLKMFNKSMDEGVKGDNLGIVFELEKGVRPQSGDTVIKYKDTHVIDTSDIVN